MLDVGRLLGSFADAVLGVGQDAIRAFLRERIPGADVARVVREREDVVLEGVTIPIGPRGLLTLDRAVLAITARMPPLRLEAFTGTLRFGEDAFVATVRFSAAPAPDEEAWVWGELVIDEARFVARSGTHQPLAGRALLSLGATAWRLDGGRLDGAIVRARFAGGGTFAPDTEGLLLPRALSSVAIGLEQGKVGAFCDALGALAGQHVVIPGWLPLDAELDAELTWSATDGARGEATVRSAPVRGKTSLAFGPRGEALAGSFDGAVYPAAVLRRLGGEPAAAPRDEDAIAIVATASGAALAPVVEAKLSATELGFRLGRPRFVPPTFLRGLVGEVHWGPRLQGGEGQGHLSAHVLAMAQGNPLELSVTGRKARLVAPVVGVAFLRDMLRTLGTKVDLPDTLVGAVDLAWDGALGGEATLLTPASALRIAPLARGVHVTGHVGASELPIERSAAGAVGIDLETDLRTARGTLVGQALVIDVGGRAVDLDGTVVRVALAPGVVDVATEAGSSLRHHAGKVTGALALADVSRVVTLPLAGIVGVDLRIEGDVVLGTLAAASLEVTAARSRIMLGDVHVRLRADRTRVMWNDARGLAHGGSFSTRGVFFRDRSFLARGSVSGIAVDSIPLLAGRVAATAVRGRLDGAARARRRAGDVVVGEGNVVLHDAAFPVLERVVPLLEKYGLEPPPVETVAPATAKLRATEWGYLVEAIAVDLAGAKARGGVGLSHERVLEGAIEVTLAEEYLKKNKALTLPRIFVERLAVPIKIAGTLDAPELSAEVGSTLGRALVDNRVTAWFGREKRASSSTMPAADLAIESELDAVLGEVAEDWARI